MAENKESYSIMETAKMVGISRQAVYKYIDELNKKGYLSINKNKQSREISSDGVEYLQEKFKDKRNVTNIIVKNNEPENNKLPSLMENEEFINTIKFGYQTLAEQFQILQTQNKEKDLLIAEKDKRIAELTDKITEFANKQLSLPEPKQKQANESKDIIKTKQPTQKTQKNKGKNKFFKDFFNIKINKK